MNDLIDEQSARRLIAPHQHLIVDAFNAAWDAWCNLQTDHPKLTRAIKPATRAAILNNLWTVGVRELLADRPGIRLREDRGFLTVFIDNVIVIRFKKLDAKGRARNYPTRQQLLFSAQLPLTGMPDEVTRLTAGYQLDPAQADITDILLTLPVGKNVVWSFSMRSRGEVVYLDAEHPASPAGPGSTVRAPRRAPSEEVEGS